MEARRAGYLIRYTTLDDVVRELRQADQLGTLRTKLSHYQRPHVLIVDLCRYRDYADILVASNPWKRRCPLRTNWGSNELSRSLGALTLTAPCSGRECLR